MTRPFRDVGRPAPDEYLSDEPPYHDLLPLDGSVLDQLEAGYLALRELLLPLSEELLHYRYAPDKWDIRETVVHLLDTERVFTYRALRFARNDQAVLKGYDHLAFTKEARVGHRSMESLMNEYAAVRYATIALFNGLDDQALLRRGVANNETVSVRGIAYHIAGHELHHKGLLQQLYLRF
jgi:uncharacterized damage-inducible protein DinB